MTNLRNPVMRHNVAVMMAGKMLGLGILLALMVTFLPSFAHAQGTGSDATAQINAINTVWVMVAAFLVFCMQAGFVMLEAGFAHSRESVNILIEGIADTFICGILFWAWGFAFMFEPGTPLNGSHELPRFRWLDGCPHDRWRDCAGWRDCPWTTAWPRLQARWWRATPVHDLIVGAVGGLILWFGWYGFNPGSTLSALDTQGVGRVAFNTTLAACSGGLVTLFYSFARSKKWDLGLTVNGFLGGLVAITAPCYWVSPTGAFFIGIGAGFAVVWGLDLLEHLRIDDPIGAVPVHMMAGVWGTLSLGLWATGEFGLPTATGADTTTVVTGLFYGGGVTQLITQIIGSAATLGGTLVVAFALMYAVKATGTLRVSREGELEGLDLHELWCVGLS